MPVSLEFLRGVLGALSLFFAHFLGRSLVDVRRGKLRKRALYMWVLRYAVTIGAVCWRAVDRMAIIVIALDIVAFALGVWDQRRPRQEEDLTGTMFPKDE